MSTVTDKLQDLIAAKSDMKAAIIEKGVTPTGGLSTYAEAIRNIEGTGGDYSSEKLVPGTKFAYSTFKEFPNYDTSGIKDMKYFFYNCDELVSVPMINTSNVTSMEGMFEGHSKLTNVPLFDTSKVSNMKFMFSAKDRDNIYNIPEAVLTAVPHFNTQNVTDMKGMFSLCYNITTVPHFNTGNVTDMSEMFYKCEKLTAVPHFNTGNVTDMNYMFYGCIALTSIPQFDTSNVTDMGETFDKCININNIPLLNCCKLESMNYTFYLCYKLSNIDGFTDLGKPSDFYSYRAFKGCYAITRNSILNIFNNLYDRKSAGYNDVELAFESDVISRLSSDDIAVATNKGWIISSYT